MEKIERGEDCRMSEREEGNSVLFEREEVGLRVTLEKNFFISKP